MKYYINLIFMIAGLILGYFLFNTHNRQIQYKEVLIRDTIIKEIKQKPLIIEKTVPKIIYMKDTIIKTRPFIAKIDTIIIKDTINAEYRFPEHSFSMYVNRARDTLAIPQITKIKHKKEKWWIKPVVFSAGFITGFILNND